MEEQTFTLAGEKFYHILESSMPFLSRDKERPRLCGMFLSLDTYKSGQKIVTFLATNAVSAIRYSDAQGGKHMKVIGNQKKRAKNSNLISLFLDMKCIGKIMHSLRLFAHKGYYGDVVCKIDGNKLDMHGFSLDGATVMRLAGIEVKHDTFPDLHRIYSTFAEKAAAIKGEFITKIIPSPEMFKFLERIASINTLDPTSGDYSNALIEVMQNEDSFTIQHIGQPGIDKSKIISPSTINVPFATEQKNSGVRLKVNGLEFLKILRAGGRIFRTTYLENKYDWEPILINDFEDEKDIGLVKYPDLRASFILMPFITAE